MSFLITGVLFNFAHAVEPSFVMGQGLYEQKGSNSCSFCHGIKGVDGSVAIAAKLTMPKTWKSFKALGGEAAYSKDKSAFLKNFEETLVDLIAKGASLHNSSFKRDWHDFKKAGGTINSQMMGMGGGASAAWLKKYSERGVTKDIAAKAAFEFIKSFDTQGVF